MHEQLNRLLTVAVQRSAQQITIAGFVFLMVVSLASSLFVAYLYVHFYSSRSTGSQVHRAFPLLGISVTAIFVTIQFSLPLSLGLLGALSIVRFRTPVKEPEEIGFVMLVIAVSLATATFQLAFVGITLIVALAALLVQRYARNVTRTLTDGTIVISLPSESAAGDATAVADLLSKRLRKATLESVSQTERETVMSYNFEGVAEGSLLGLQAELSATANRSTYNVFVNRPGGL